MLLARLPEMPHRPRGNESEEQQDHGHASGRHEKAHNLPPTSRESGRNVGVRLETRTRPSTPSKMEDDPTADHRSSCRRYAVRHGRMRRSRPGTSARSLCRDAADLQEHDGDARRHRSVHAAIRRRARHHVDAASHVRG